MSLWGLYVVGDLLPSAAMMHAPAALDLIDSCTRFSCAEPTIMEDSDMAGPLVFCLALGFFLLLTGKLHFGYIYGFGMCGCVAMYMLLNLMSNSKTLDLSRTFSVFGYCLLPIVLLSAINVLFSLKAGIGAFLAFLAVCWCTLGATRIFETAMSMREQRYLIAYPAFLLYAVFALITIF